MAACAVAGTTSLLTASELGYAALRNAGTVYLLWLGIQALTDSSICAEILPGQTVMPLPSTGWRRRHTGLLPGIDQRPAEPKAAASYLALASQLVVALSGTSWYSCSSPGSSPRCAAPASAEHRRCAVRGTDQPGRRARPVRLTP